MELNKIYNEECLAGMRRIPDSSIDSVICDLPYGSTSCAWDSVIPFEPLWEQYHRVCKPDAAIVLFGSEPFSTRLRMSNLKEFRYDWIWHKSSSGGFAMANRRPMKFHETISVFYREQPTYNPQYIPYAESTQKRFKDGVVCLTIDLVMPNLDPVFADAIDLSMQMPEEIKAEVREMFKDKHKVSFNDAITEKLFVFARENSVV